MKEADLKNSSSLITREEIETILAIRGKNRIEKILDFPNPAALVAKIPEIEIFLTIKEVGEQDAIELISLTTLEQLIYLIDLDLWDKDQIAPDRFLSWLEILFQCGENKLAQFFQAADLELLASSFRKVMRVLTTPHPEDAPLENKASSHFSLDEIYYIEFLEERAAPLLMRLLHFLYGAMPDFYQILMKQILWGIPAEDEELALRWRNGRLADHGFPAFDEAIEIYSYVSPQKIKQASSFVLPEPIEVFYPPPYLEVVSKGTFFSLIIKNDLPEGIQDRVKWELNGLINRVLIADGAHLGNVKTLFQSAQKALQTLDLGLKYLSQENPEEARRLLEKVPVTRIFQVGYSLGLELKRKAQVLVSKGWLAKLPRREEILDSPLKETIKGLLRKRPLFYDEFDGKFLPFATLSEISQTADRLEKISFLGEFFHELLNISPEEIMKIEKTRSFFPDPPLSTICLTYFSHNLLSGQEKLAPLNVSDLQNLYVRLRQEGLLDDQTRILSWLKERTSHKIIVQGNNLSEQKKKLIVWWLEFLQNRFHSCLALILPGERIDPRAVDIFLVSLPD